MFPIAIGTRNPFAFAPPTACTGTPYDIQIGQQQQQSQHQIQNLLNYYGAYEGDNSVCLVQGLPMEIFNNVYKPEQQFEEDKNAENWGQQFAKGTKE